MYSTFSFRVVPYYYVFCVWLSGRFTTGVIVSQNFIESKLAALKKKFKKPFDMTVKSTINNDRRN